MGRCLGLKISLSCQKELYPKAANKFTKNSGNEVPNATTVKPIIKVLTPNLFDKAIEPSTNRFDPLTNKNKPMIKRAYSIINNIFTQYLKSFQE